MKKLCILYEMLWSKEWFTDHEIEKDKSEIDFKEDLKKIAPNEEEYESIMEEYANLDKEKQEEISEYFGENIKPLIDRLYDDIKENDPSKNKLTQVIQKLENKLQELKEQGKDNYNSSEFVKATTQSVLLKNMFSAISPEIEGIESPPVPPEMKDDFNNISSWAWGTSNWAWGNHDEQF